MSNSKPCAAPRKVPGCRLLERLSTESLFRSSGRDRRVPHGTRLPTQYRVCRIPFGVLLRLGPGTGPLQPDFSSPLELSMVTQAKIPLGTPGKLRPSDHPSVT